MPTPPYDTRTSPCPSCNEMLTALTTTDGYPHTGRCNCGHRFVIPRPDWGVEWEGPRGYTVSSPEQVGGWPARVDVPVRLEGSVPDHTGMTHITVGICPGCSRSTAIDTSASLRYPHTGECRGCGTLYVVLAPGADMLWDQAASRSRRAGQPRQLTPEEVRRRQEEEAVYRLERQQARRPDDARPDPYKDEADQ